MNRTMFLLLMAAQDGAASNIWQPQGWVLEASVAGEQSMNQEPNVIYEGSAQILSGNVFKMWYSAGVAQRDIYYAESTDGIAWTRHPSNPVKASVTRSFILKNGATYYMFALGGGSFNRYSSSDGVTWATDGSNVLNGTGGQWDADGIANTCVWIEGSTWYMLYESSHIGTNNYQIGLATSPDGLTWTKYGSNPVITNGAGSVSGPYVVKNGSTYTAWCHAAASGVLPTDITKYWSTDLHTWTKTSAVVTYPRNTLDEGLGQGAGQVADASLLQVGGTTYMFYAGYYNGALATGGIKLAIANYGLGTVAQSSEGLVTNYKPSVLYNGGFEKVGAGGADVFDKWAETVSNGAIARTGAAGEFRAGTSGLYAVKLTAGASVNTCIDLLPGTPNWTPGATYKISGWARGDGTHAGRVRVYGSSDLIADWDSNPITVSATYTYFTRTFVADAANIDIILYCPNTNGGYACFDDLALTLA